MTCISSLRSRPTAAVLSNVLISARKSLDLVGPPSFSMSLLRSDSRGVSDCSVLLPLSVRDRPVFVGGVRRSHLRMRLRGGSGVRQRLPGSSLIISGTAFGGICVSMDCSRALISSFSSSSLSDQVKTTLALSSSSIEGLYWRYASLVGQPSSPELLLLSPCRSLPWG